MIAPVFYGNTFAAEVVANPSWLVNIGGVTLLRAFSIFPDPHVFSFYLGLMIPLVFVLIFLSREDLEAAGMIKNKNLIYFAFLVMLFSELFTFSRGGYFGMAASFFMMMILLWKYFTKMQRNVFLLILMSGIIFMTSVNNSILTRLLSSFDFGEGSNVERIRNWQEGWNVFSNNLFTGVGIGNYSFYLYPATTYRTPIYAHNLYLDLGAEMGIFSLLVWVILMAVTICGLYSASKKTKDKALSHLALGLIGSLVWYSAHSFFDDSIYAPNVLSVLVVILSLSVLVIRYVKIEADNIIFK
jgi:O-antigen ligase